MNKIQLIEELSKVSGMYDIVNTCLTPNTLEWKKAMELVDKQWKLIEELKKDAK